MERQPFDVLGIERTDDKKEIKKAYARLVRKYHPEEYPKEWKQIHVAFQEAMQYAENFGQPERRYISVEKEEEYIFEEREREVFEEEEQNAAFEEETYENEFIRIQEGADKSEEECTEEVIEALGQCFKWSYARWQSFLTSEALRGASEEALRMLLVILRREKLKRKIWKLIEDSMKEQSADYWDMLEFEKADLSLEIAEWCHKKAKKKDTKDILLSFTVIIIISIIRGLRLGEVEKSNFVVPDSKEIASLSAGEAVAMAVEYVNEKYHLEYTADDFQIERYVSRKMSDGKRQIIGHKFWTEGENPLTIYVLDSGKKRGKRGAVCFDTRQVEEVTRALEEEAEKLTGCAKGRLFLDTSFAEEMKDSELNMFHAAYEGDLSQFFAEELEAREETGWGEDDSDRYVRASFYAPDSQCATMKERFEEGKSADGKKFKKGLEKLEETYQIRCTGSLLPGEYYQELMQNEEEESGKNEKNYWLMGGQSSRGKTEPAISPAFVTWYYPGKSADGSKADLKRPEIQKFEKGVYLIRDQIDEAAPGEEIYLLAVDKTYYGEEEPNYIIAEVRSGEEKIFCLRSYAGKKIEEEKGYFTDENGNLVETECAFIGGGYIYLYVVSAGGGEMPDTITIDQTDGSVRTISPEG